MAEAALTFSCPVCLEIPRDPVTIPCGHSYCMRCITDCWDQDDQKKVFSCPECRQTFSQRPALKKNTMLADLADKLRSTTEDPLCEAGPHDVQCDVCTDKKYKAVKSCLVCVVSFCDLHLKPHAVSPAYKSHKLVSAFCNVQELICPTHKKPMEVYCRTEQQFVCLFCVLEKHRDHDIVSAADERKTQQRAFKDMQSNSKHRIQGTEDELTHLRTAVGTIRSSAQEAVEHIEKIYAEMMSSIKAQCNEITHLIRDREETAVSQAENLQEQLEEEISELKKRDANIETVLQSDDDIMFLFQSIQSLSNPPKTENLPWITLNSHGLFEHVRKSVLKRHHRVMDLLQQDHIQLSDEVQTMRIFLPHDPKTKEEFLQYSCQLTLDLKTAHNNLHFSEGNTNLTWGPAKSNPDNPERFDNWWQVLNKEGLTGCSYWEVEWSGTVFIAVSYKSIKTKGAGIECGFGRNDQSWCLYCTSSHFAFWHGNTETNKLNVPSSSRVGVYMDHNAGILSFYDVSDKMTLIHKVQTTFTQPLYPGFGSRLGFLGSIKISPNNCLKKTPKAASDHTAHVLS